MEPHSLPISHETMMRFGSEAAAEGWIVAFMALVRIRHDAFKL